MKTFAAALLLATSPVVAQVCPREAPFPTSPIHTASGQPLTEGTAGYLAAYGASECPLPPDGVGGCGEQAYFIQSCDLVQWSFGDGTTATETGSDHISHTYEHFGLYHAKVHITNALGAADAEGTVYVTRSPLTIIDADRSVRANEADGSVTVHCTRSGDLSRSNRVDWRLTSYEIGIMPATGTFTFQPGETGHDLTFPILWDHRWSGNYDSDLRLNVTADGALSNQYLTQYTAGEVLTTILVDDADPIPVGILRDVTVSKGSATVRVPLDLTTEFAFKPVVVTWAWFHTIDGSARDGVDYTGTAGSPVTLEADANRVFIEIPLKANASSGNRTFDVEIPASLLPMLRRRATVTITDEPIIADPVRTSLAAGAYATLTLSIGGSPTGSLPVTLSSSDPAVVVVPSTATIPADRPAVVLIHGINAGHATITITAGGGQTSTVEVQVVQVRRRAVR